jgi:hypothetical protein
MSTCICMLYGIAYKKGGARENKVGASRLLNCYIGAVTFQVSVGLCSGKRTQN